MIPTDAISLVPRVAEELGLDEHLVKSLVENYWHKIRKSMVNLDSPYLGIRNLGQFHMMRFKVQSRLKTFESLVEKFPDHGLYYHKERNIQMVNKLRRILREMDASDVQRKKKRDMRYGVYAEQE